MAIIPAIPYAAEAVAVVGGAVGTWMMNQWVKDQRDQSEAEQRQKEYQTMKDRCDKKPQPTGNNVPIYRAKSTTTRIAQLGMNIGTTNGRQAGTCQKFRDGEIACKN